MVKTLSLYLYVIIANIFSILLNEDVKRNKITLFNIKGKHKLLHLMYVDDIIQFVRANRKTSINLNKLVSKYYDITGCSKSRIYFPKHYHPDTRFAIAELLGLSQGTYAFNYLGSHINPSYKPSQLYKEFLDDFLSKLQT